MANLPKKSEQQLNLQPNRPSKYKLIQPTLVESLVKVYPDKYKAPHPRELDMLHTDDLVKFVYINKQDVWCHVDNVDDDVEPHKVYAKLSHHAPKLDMQKGQRVQFTKEHIIEIADHDDDDDDY
ncbi:hypothetical protein WJX72_008032 [[Myrmecia] bisecta]|uniref:Uncharacterized protein n=1 Tax=[Myrmecia] bisecta TaxID=41462 RepID=A0AAW1R853_9CHLO